MNRLVGKGGFLLELQPQSQFAWHRKQEKEGRAWPEVNETVKPKNLRSCALDAAKRIKKRRTITTSFRKGFTRDRPKKKGGGRRAARIEHEAHSTNTYRNQNRHHSGAWLAQKKLAGKRPVICNIWSARAPGDAHERETVKRRNCNSQIPRGRNCVDDLAKDEAKGDPTQLNE